MIKEKEGVGLTRGELRPLQQPSLQRDPLPVSAEELRPDPVPLEELVALAERRQSLGCLDLVDVREHVRAVGPSRGRGALLVRLIGQKHTHSRGVEYPGPRPRDPLVFLSTAVAGVHAGLATCSSRHSSKAHINLPGAPCLGNAFLIGRETSLSSCCAQKHNPPRPAAFLPALDEWLIFLVAKVVEFSSSD